MYTFRSNAQVNQGFLVLVIADRALQQLCPFTCIVFVLLDAVHYVLERNLTVPGGKDRTPLLYISPCVF